LCATRPQRRASASSPPLPHPTPEAVSDAVTQRVRPSVGRATLDDQTQALGACPHLRVLKPALVGERARRASPRTRPGRDTGLASAREVTIRGWPRSGVPRAMRDFEDFCASAHLLARAADVPDYTWFLWKLRPHPRLGTVPGGPLRVSARLPDADGWLRPVDDLLREALVLARRYAQFALHRSARRAPSGDGARGRCRASARHSPDRRDGCSAT
jgi:hypothetical protein